MRPPLLATTPNAWRPMGGEAIPFAASFVHVAPPSADLKIAGSRVNGGPPGVAGGSPGTIGRTSDAPPSPAAGYNVANITRGAPGAPTPAGEPARSPAQSTLAQ